MPSRRDPWKDPAIARGLLSLAEEVRAQRVQRGWTLEELAEHADLDLRHVQLVEAGHANPTLATLLRLARGFDLAPERLLGARQTELKSATGAYRARGTAEREPAPASDALVALRVKALRLVRDWSQRDLASASELSTSAVQGLEAGLKSPTLRTVDALARALGVRVHELLDPHAAPEKRSRARVSRR